MSHRVCPWWVGYFLISPLRRLRQNPAEILALFVHEGQTVLEPGPGMGFFTLELARRVGTTGRVVVVDIQPKMLERLKQRAAKATLIDRISIRLASPDSMGIEELANSVDFALAFAIVHEFPDASRFFREVAAACKVGAQLLLAEPKGHVKEADFDSELRSAAKAGFELIGRPAIRGSNAAVFKKQ